MIYLTPCNTIDNEYVLGDYSGTMQYKKTVDEIINGINIDNPSENRRGFILEEHTIENKLRLIPNTKTGNSNEWKLLLVMKKIDENNVIWLKGALLNKETGNIALMTSTYNNNDIRDRYTYSKYGNEWYVGRYRMSAPYFFWKELVNVLTN